MTTNVIFPRVVSNNYVVVNTIDGAPIFQLDLRSSLDVQLELMYNLTQKAMQQGNYLG